MLISIISFVFRNGMPRNCIARNNLLAIRFQYSIPFSSIKSKNIVVKKADSAITPSSLNDFEQCEYSRILSMYGFSFGQIKRILHPMNNIKSVDEYDIAENLQLWHTFRVNKKHLLTVLSSYPELLTLNPLYVKKREEELFTLFTKGDISKLLITCPQVFLDDFETVQAKVEYIVNFMGVEQNSIVKTEALKFDISYMKLRHTFVKYLGVFKSYKKKERNRNPPLSKVFSSNLNTFLKLSTVTEEEFTAFCGCYDEIKDEEEIEIGDETESEEENSDSEE